MKENIKDIKATEIFSFFTKILKAESSFFWISIVYVLAISFLSLAVPLSVQFLINSVSFTAMVQPMVVLGFVLLIVLTFWASLNALQFFITEIFQRHFFARIACEITILLLKNKEKTPNNIPSVISFFETITIQKTIPKFLTKTSYTILQGLIGLILISFYHPIFFLFSIIIAVLLYLIWSLFYKQAIASSVAKSQSKYDLVECFEQITNRENIAEVDFKNKVNSLTGDYIENRKECFKSLFSQVILLLILYVVASVALLMIGGSLILNSQLTIGQLVAAELVLSTTLYNFSQLGRDLENFYDLAASCQKLSKFYNFSFEKKDFASFTNFRSIKTPKPLKILPKIILISLAAAILILSLTPWQQTSQGFGYIIASDPNDRTQNINAPIGGRIKKWYVRDGSVVKKDDKLVEIVDNDHLILDRMRLELDAKKRKLQASQIASQTSKINYHRQEELFTKGLSSRRDFEEAKIEYKKLLAIEESSASELAEAETKFSRQDNQIIVAPKDGMILKVLAGNSATLVKSGDHLASFAPNLSDSAVEIYVSGNDIPLIKEGRKVRLQFEGWPIIQFSGWPSLAIGTFGGIVTSVDSSVSENGKFRVIIKKDQNEKWPDQRFLRHGAKSQAWILLNNVSLGYEFWRQLNSFPPSFDDHLKPTSKKDKEKSMVK